MSKLINSMLTEEELESFYPQLASRILLFLRQQRFQKETVLTEDLIERFHKSKSIISQVLTSLSDKHYIERTYIKGLRNQGSRHRISITLYGLNIANAILSEGLDPIERKAIISSRKKVKKFRIRK